MVTSPIPQTLRAHCIEGDHALCPHYWSSGFRKRPREKVESLTRLCTCECHRDCPLWPSTEVATDDWLDLCSCPAAEKHKEGFRESL